MTTFDARDAGTTEARWRASARLADLADVPRAARDRHLVTFAAHPDDETLGAGGLLAAAALAGAAITVVVATDGDASHPKSATHTPAQLARRRRAEATAAITILAPAARIRFLGLPDGHLSEQGELLREALREIVRASDRTTLLLSTYRHDRHPDHEACGQAAADVAAEHDVALWEFPIWMWHWADADADADADAHDPLPWSSMRRFPIPPAAAAAKQAAMQAYASQHSPLSEKPGDEVVLPQYIREHFQRPFETFMVSAPAARPGYFARLYADSDDPWGLSARYYEQRKRAVVMASLPRARFRRAFEPGCALGLNTVELARRCDEVVAWDIAGQAVEHTRALVTAAQTASAPNGSAHRPGTEAPPGTEVPPGTVAPLGTGALGTVEVSLGAVPAQWPTGRFDLILISEIGYFITDLAALSERITACLEDDGVLVACHWRSVTVESPSTTEAVHAALGAGRTLLVHHLERDFLLQIWSPTDASELRADGIGA